jgi:hypothetical protein
MEQMENFLICILKGLFMLLDVLFDEFNYIFFGPNELLDGPFIWNEFLLKARDKPCGLKPGNWAVETISVGCVAINVPKKRVLLK